MNSGQTAERVYDAIKLRIREHGFRPGTRLDPAPLAADLLSSVTPVRDALNRLTGERLVDTRASDGFHLPAIDAPALQDLYDWNVEVLMLAIRSWPMHAAPIRLRRESATALLVDACFAAVAGRSGNAEHAGAIDNLNDRLHAVRLHEGDVLEDIPAEMDAIAGAIEEDRRPDLRTRIVAYHRRRRRSAPEIVRALYRAPPTFAG